MRTTTRRAAVLVAAGALGLGGVAVAAPALAGVGPFANSPVAASTPGRGGGMMGTGSGMGSGMGSGYGTGAGYGMGTGAGYGMGTGAGYGMGSGYGTGSGYGMGGSGMMGTGALDGTCLGLAITAEKGTLTDQQKATLGAMAQEEKLAHDLYAAFAGKYDAVVFDRIAASEARHLATVRALLTRYGVADPTAGRPDGQFSDAAVRATYDKLLAQGQAGQAAALRVGVTVEQTDVADLTAALNGLSAPDVTQAYTQLRAASQHHLAAFQDWSTR